jgi:hypothetical protein
MAGLVIAHDDAVAPRAWAGLGIVAGASFVTSLDALVLYVAFGAIHRDFPHIGAPALSWVLSGYTIVIAAGMIAAGRCFGGLRRRAQRQLADRLQGTAGDRCGCPDPGVTRSDPSSVPEVPGSAGNRALKRR